MQKKRLIFNVVTALIVFVIAAMMSICSLIATANRGANAGERETSISFPHSSAVV